MIPILNPAGVQEILDYGLYGFALSRFAGTWVGDQMREGQHRIDRGRSTARSTGEDRPCPTIRHAAGRAQHPPRDDQSSAGGAAARLQARGAMLAFVRANKLNRIVYSGGRNPEDRHHHHRQELSRRAPGARRARHRRGARRTIGLRLFKVGCPWPLEPEHCASSPAASR
jgi:indolepyruvate ferredoxin oxidoreductase